jgi:hypothetical protein
MNAFDIINDIATFLLYIYFTFIFMLRFKEHPKNVRWFNLLVLIYITFLMSKVIIKYI